MISYIYWPAVDGHFDSGNLLVSLLGAMIVIAFSAGVAYAEAQGLQDYIPLTPQ